MAGEIDQYVDYFLGQIRIIKEIESALFQKILFAAIIDTISRARFPKAGNRERIVGLIDQCSTWKDKDRVSLPQLLLYLREKGINTGTLFKEVNDRVNAWQPDAILRPEVDPMLQEILPYATSDAETQLIRLCRYAELFYTYRTILIHEFREPGHGIALSRDGSTSYYHSMVGEPWQLVFPREFFEQLCLNCLRGLRTYLENDNIDPYGRYDLGSMWRRR